MKKLVFFAHKKVFSFALAFAFIPCILFSDSISDLNRFTDGRLIWTFEHGMQELWEFAPKVFEGLPDESFYDASSDDGSWVTDVVAKCEPFLAHDAAVASSSFEEAEASGTDSDVFEAIRTQAEDLRPDFFMLGNTGKLSLYGYEDESFTVSYSNQYNERLVASASPERVVRRYYDDSMKITKKETWQLSESVGESKITETSLYSYDDLGLLKSEQILSEKQRHFIFFDERGFVTSEDFYELFKTSDEDDGKFIHKKHTAYLYSTNDRLVQKTEETFFYNKTATRKTKTTNHKEIYEYKVEDAPPDSFIYENDVLTLSTVHSAPGTYKTTAYFNGGFVIESYYENSSRKKDIYYVNGIQRRTKIYE